MLIQSISPVVLDLGSRRGDSGYSPKRSRDQGHDNDKKPDLRNELRAVKQEEKGVVQVVLVVIAIVVAFVCISSGATLTEGMHLMCQQKRKEGELQRERGDFKRYGIVWRNPTPVGKFGESNPYMSFM